MCDRNSVYRNLQTPTTTLRRSPRFVEQVQPDTFFEPKTPKIERSRSRGSYSDVDPFQKGSLNKCLEQRKGEGLEREKDAYLKPKHFTISSVKQQKLKNRENTGTHCLRRSTRFSGVCNVKGNGYEEYKKDDFSKLGIQRRVEEDEVSEKENHFRSKISKKLRSAEQGISRGLDGISKNSHRSRCSSSGFPGDSKYFNNKDTNRDDLLNKTERVFDFPRKFDVGISRPVTRGFVSRNKEVIGGSSITFSGEVEVVEDAQKRLDEQKIKAGANSSEQCLYKVEKRVTRSSTCRTERRDNIQNCGDCKGEKRKPIKNVSFECPEKVSSEQYMTGQKCRSNSSTEGTDRKRVANEVEKEFIGTKRKRDDEAHRIVQGWTREQELALQRAYLEAKPTPRFWKKVSKMVPGKSAQDCFDKIHSDHLTPPRPKPRTRARSTNSSSLSLSASKLLTSPEPKQRKRQRKTFLSRKAVRGLLQRQCKRNQDDEADLFSVLEPTVDPSIRVIPNGTLFSTPECYKNTPRHLERSSSAQRKQLPSRLNASGGATLTSPPVLKQVKNKALHEKYIDQLHAREVKRKAASLRATKCILEKNDAKPNDGQSSQVLKAAKDALIVDAREIIRQFQHQRNCMENDDDDDDDVFDEDDIEDGL